ncbi:Hydrolase of the alpha/beta superfamily [Hahella chejuensis KCTC 2396]|uniref:Hydrolase of the alpha/beta superfamily n=1 Tax=Hahella chejuensis (strain KCTC 2396) TaxID=349521 RepID=Q2SE85_HAHCH|nr:alpha/beta fold hydrolase [Hahella chejuensis]ABC31039.1 Hydrolase of the alpha/beta superfamily [Hahella chejuensis KCTC 2396]
MKIVAGLLFVCVLVAVLVLGVLDQHSLKYGRRTDFTFPYDGQRLGATLLTPEGDGPFPVVVFLHGDGPVDRFANGGYVAIMNRLLERGVACLSWDKQGVGESSGDWLAQSMRERAGETVAGVKALRGQAGVDVGAVGVMAFSQGGWVLSELARGQADIDFMVAVGVAVNWRRQSLYLQRERMLRQGYSKEDIATALEFSEKADRYLAQNNLSYDQYLAWLRNSAPPAGVLTEPMSPERYRFAMRNMQADMSAGLARVNVPFLGLFGDKDRNVDFQESMRTIDSAFHSSNWRDYQLTLFPGATHSLLKAKYFDFQTPSEWTSSAEAMFLVLGPDAFVEGFLDTLGDWVVARSKDAEKKATNSQPGASGAQAIQ